MSATKEPEISAASGSWEIQDITTLEMARLARYEVIAHDGLFGWLEVSNGGAEGHWIWCRITADALDLFPEGDGGIDDMCAAIVKAMADERMAVTVRAWVRGR